MMHGELINQLTAEVNRVIQKSPELRKLWLEARERGLEMNAKLEFTYIRAADRPDNAWLESLYALEDKR